MSEKNSILHLPKISGLITKCIMIAFADFIQDKDGFEKEMEYYAFNYEIDQNKICVKITFNFEMMFKELYIAVNLRGGGGEYLIDMETREILSKSYYR